MTTVRQLGGWAVSDEETNDLPLAAVGVRSLEDPVADLPMAYVPRIPDSATFREVLERAVGWGRR